MGMICDDRIYAPGGELDQVRKMTDEEFKEYIDRLKAKEAEETKNT